MVVFQESSDQNFYFMQGVFPFILDIQLCAQSLNQFVNGFIEPNWTLYEAQYIRFFRVYACYALSAFTYKLLVTVINISHPSTWWVENNETLGFAVLLGGWNLLIEKREGYNAQGK